MKSVFFRIVVFLSVLMIAAVALPAVAEKDYTVPDPASCASAWWDYCPPKVITKTRVVVREPENLIESIPAEGYCYTAIKQVNVRSRPSIYATKVRTIRAARTEFIVTARVKNSSGEIWYAVQLANGTLGYIRSDLVNTDHVILLGDPYSYESEVSTRPASASESASSVVNIMSPAVAPAPTPQVIYVVMQPEAQQPETTPIPVVVYVTPEPSKDGDS